MNSLNLHHPRPSTRRIAVPCLLLALACLLAGSPQLLNAQFFQSDDFNDGNDNGWTQYNPFADVGAHIVRWEFPNGGYRIRTTAPSPMYDPLGPGRAGSLRSEIHTDFYIAVDIVNWNNTLPQSAGILARVRNAGLGTTTGYAFTWDRGNPTSDTAGDVDISTITGEAPSGVTVTGSDRLHIEPGKSYRLVFIGRGPTLEGRVYELPDTTTPKVAVIGTDTTYDSGAGGLVVYDNSDGGTNVCDVTFDNFYTTDVEPPRIKVTDLFFGEYELSWPAEASAYVLQSSTVLPGTAADWTDQASSLSGDRYVYTMEASPPAGGLPQRYFRLIRRPAGGN
jgi:hypothetical protein